MITGCKLLWLGLFGLFLSVAAAPSKRFLPAEPLPKRKFEIGDRVRTERIYDDRISQNYLGIDWECGLVVDCCWQCELKWLIKNFYQGWTYWVRFDFSNWIENGDRLWLDFAHETELAIVKNYPKKL